MIFVDFVSHLHRYYVRILTTKAQRRRNEHRGLAWKQTPTKRSVPLRLLFQASSLSKNKSHFLDTR
jgi:hypothetical protein